MSMKVPTIDTPQLKDLARNWAMVEIDPVNNQELASIPWRWQELVAHIDGKNAATAEALQQATQRADRLAADLVVLTEQLQAAQADAARFAWALPLIVGDRDLTANERAIVLALILSGGTEGIDAIDDAMKITASRALYESVRAANYTRDALPGQARAIIKWQEIHG